MMMFLIIVVVIVVLLLFLLVTEKLLNIWHYLQTAPIWVTFVYMALIVSIAFLGWYLYFVLVKVKSSPDKIKPLDESSLRESIAHQAERGVDIEPARLELQELDKRRAEDVFHIALYGTVSSGKSSFIKALLPDQSITTHVLSGSTKSIDMYRYKNLSIIDLPGLDDPSDDDRLIKQVALDESIRAHVVVFLTDSDLTQTEMLVIDQLKGTKKPLVIALNKSDRYSEDEQAILVDALRKKTNGKYPVALISTGGQETLVYQDENGKQYKKVQTRQPCIEPLLKAIEKVVVSNPVILNRFRDVAMLMLAQDKLNDAQLAHNRSQAETVVNDYTKKAIVGAMASVAPGSDIVIQGALAAKMIQSICQIYEVSPKQMEIDQVIRLTGGKVKTSVSLILALAGNALKAFPGVGTAVGGVTHAVSYGMIFNALGLAVLESISTLGVLDSLATQQKFEENLLGPTQKLAKDLAKMALRID